MRGRGAAAELAARSHLLAARLHLLAARLHLLATWADEHWRRAERRGVEAFELRPGRRVDPHRIVAARAARLAVAQPEADSQPATGESARVIYGIYVYSIQAPVEIDWIASERNARRDLSQVPLYPYTPGYARSTYLVQQGTHPARGASE